MRDLLSLSLPMLRRGPRWLALVTLLFLFSEIASTDLKVNASNTPPPSAVPLDLDAIGERAPACLPDCAFFRDEDISQQSLAEPSLWWLIAEIGPRLIPDWVVYPDEARVDLVLDPQRWNWMTYFERYTLMTRIAHVLRPRGYDFRLFDPQQPDRAVANYTCDFAIVPPDCTLQLLGTERYDLR